MVRLNSSLAWSIAALAVVAVASISLNGNAFRYPSSRIELIPEGAEWVLGHTGDGPAGVIAPLPAEFTARHGSGWSQRLSGPSGGFRRIWGQGIDFGGAVMSDASAALAAAEQFWRDNEYLLPRGVTAEQLVPVSGSHFRGVRIVGHRQTLDGVPVLGTSSYLVFMSGRLVLIGARNLPTLDFDGTPAISEAAAVGAAVAGLADLGIEAEAGAVDLVALPLVADDTLSYELVFGVALDAGFGRFTCYVDARSGEVVALRDERLFLDATIELHVHSRHPMSTLIDAPAAFLSLDAGGDYVYTDENGVFSATADPVDVMAFLDGYYVDVNNQAGSDILLETTLADGETHVWTDEAEFEQAQLDSYVSVSNVRAYLRALVDDMTWLDSTQLVNTNIYDMDGDNSPDYCNAWYDGESINFLRAGGSWGGGCTNTAQNADIVHHEWGHGFHWRSQALGVNVYDGAVSEGFGDSMSVTMSHDSEIGPYFVQDGWPIRDVAPDLSWPGDQSEDPHQTGLIVAGALWDLRQLWIDEFGEPTAHDMLDDIFIQVNRTTGDVPSLWEATLLADDDNANLLDGTPHFCTIYDAFDMHGLVSGAFGRIVIEHDQIAEVPQPADPIAIDAVVYEGEEDCNTLGEVRLVYSLDDGDNWTELAMSNTDGDAYHAEIPAQPEGAEVRYRLEADELESGDTIVRPNNDAEPFYKFYVGPLEEIFCDDFEASDGGWTHELIAGQNQLGADDWMWDTAKPNGGDPDGCYSGVKCWGNDLTPYDPVNNWNGQYQPDKVNRLTSPPFDLSQYEHVRIKFRRWLNVEDGFFDKTRILVNGQPVWSNYASPGSVYDPHTTHHLDLEWILFDLDISAQAAGQSEVRIAFELSSDGGLQFGGWTFDDFCLYTLGEVVDDNPDAGPDPDAGPGIALNPPVSGCGCDTAGEPGTAPSLIGILLSSI